jgi:type IV secretion system protein VirB1
MAYSATALLALASQCAPTVAPETVLAIIQTESNGEPFALNVNGGKQPGRQINSRNMRWLGLTWETVFDPCTNVAALARVLTTNYNSVKAGRDPQTALRVALSMYNTGSQTRGFRNGYVAKVVGNAGIANAGVTYATSLPAVGFAAPESGDLRERLTSENEEPARPILQARPTPPPKWNVFERAAYERETLILAENERGSI